MQSVCKNSSNNSISLKPTWAESTTSWFNHKENKTKQKTAMVLTVTARKKKKPIEKHHKTIDKAKCVTLY